MDLINRQEAIDRIEAIFPVDPHANECAEGVAIGAALAKQYIETLPSAQPERLMDEDFEAIRIHLNAYKERLCNQHRWEEAEEYQRIIDRFMSFASAQPEQRWIPFETRPLTEEEKEEHPEWDCILNCKLPDDGQRILVAIRIRGHEEVQQDEFYSDDGSYLDSGYEIGTEAVAWMPLPEPYGEEDHETD